MPAVEENAKITQVLISPDLLPKPRMRALYLLFLPLKAILLLFQVLWTLLFRLPRADVLLLHYRSWMCERVGVWVRAFVHAYARAR